VDAKYSEREGLLETAPVIVAPAGSTSSSSSLLGKEKVGESQCFSSPAVPPLAGVENVSTTMILRLNVHGGHGHSLPPSCSGLTVSVSVPGQEGVHGLGRGIGIELALVVVLFSRHQSSLWILRMQSRVVAPLLLRCSFEAGRSTRGSGWLSPLDISVVWGWVCWKGMGKMVFFLNGEM